MHVHRRHVALCLSGRDALQQPEVGARLDRELAEEARQREIGRADELADQMAATAAGSNGGVKALLLGSFANGLEEQMELEGRLIAARAETAEGREGVDAFLAKRPPKF